MSVWLIHWALGEKLLVRQINFESYSLESLGNTIERKLDVGELSNWSIEKMYDQYDTDTDKTLMDMERLMKSQVYTISSGDSSLLRYIFCF